MLRESTSRLLTALRLALYPALESAEARHFQALTMEAQNARLSGDLAKAERLYLTAVAVAREVQTGGIMGRLRFGHRRQIKSLRFCQVSRQPRILRFHCKSLEVPRLG